MSKLSEYLNNVSNGISLNTMKRLTKKNKKETPKILKELKSLEKEREEIDDIIKKYSK
ncbi:hypothetical protein [Gracilimonas halophila]|uniref:Uncharacterized protein n=1 Tax=Gracilimonas halophila TaxID=1834464 RepID=A0ABW5JKF3_9BACT